MNQIVFTLHKKKNQKWYAHSAKLNSPIYIGKEKDRALEKIKIGIDKRGVKGEPIIKEFVNVQYLVQKNDTQKDKNKTKKVRRSKIAKDQDHDLKASIKSKDEKIKELELKIQVFAQKYKTQISSLNKQIEELKKNKDISSSGPKSLEKNRKKTEKMDKLREKVISKAKGATRKDIIVKKLAEEMNIPRTTLGKWINGSTQILSNKNLLIVEKWLSEEK